MNLPFLVQLSPIHQKKVAEEELIKMTPTEELKLILRENDIPFFKDDELEYYLTKNGGDVKKAAYECLLIKAENTSLNIGGLSTADSSAYFRRLASRYRPNNSGILT